MPLDGFRYRLQSNRHFIDRSDHRDHRYSRVHRSMPYPNGRSMVERVEASLGNGFYDAFLDCNNEDTIWAMAIAESSAHVSRISNPDHNTVLQRLIGMGLFEWGSPDRRGKGDEPPLAMRFSAVMGSALVRENHKMSTKVSRSIHS